LSQNQIEQDSTVNDNFHTMQASLPSLEIEHRQAQSSNPPQTQQGAPGATLRIVQRNQAMATKALLL